MNSQRQSWATFKETPRTKNALEDASQVVPTLHYTSCGIYHMRDGSRA